MLRANNTAASFDSATFTPAADIVLQASYNPLAIPTIAIQTRNDAAAPWATLTLWHPHSQPLMKVSTGVEVRLRISKNIAGSDLKVWDQLDA